MSLVKVGVSISAKMMDRKKTVRINRVKLVTLFFVRLMKIRYATVSAIVTLNMCLRKIPVECPTASPIAAADMWLVSEGASIKAKTMDKTKIDTSNRRRLVTLLFVMV